VKRLIFLLAIVSLAARCSAALERQDAINRLDNAARVLRETMSAPDQRIPDHILRRARCVAVVPHLIKGGFVFGGEEGKGVATCRTAEGWSAPTFIEMGGGSWGTQFGVEAVDLVMVIKGSRGLQKLLSSKFELGRDASVAVGPLGRHSSENTDAALNAMILTYSHAKGAFLGMTFDGAVVRADNSSQHAFYGPRVTNQRTLLGRVAAPVAARPFLAAVKGARAQAASHAGKRRIRPRRHCVHCRMSAAAR
jgi:lipid-binding SYLF domain-containing protein